MSKKYDESMKKFVGASPQDFADWLQPGAKFIRSRATELQSRDIFVDALCEIVLNGELLLLHLEFQRDIRSGIPERLLEYNILARRTHKLPVYSCVIYLVDDGTIEESPLVWELADGTEILRFHHISIRLWEVDPQEFVQAGREGILPLVLLTKGNATPDAVDMVIERLIAADKQDLLPVVKLLASHIFRKNSVYKSWLTRRFAMLRDILRDTEAYQEIFQEGEEKGHQEGVKEGMKEGVKEGEVLGLRRSLMGILQVRFPEVVQLAASQVNLTNDTTILQNTILELIDAQSVADVLPLILKLSKSRDS